MEITLVLNYFSLCCLIASLIAGFYSVLKGAKLL